MKWLKEVYYNLLDAMDEISIAGSNHPYQHLTIKQFINQIISGPDYCIDLDNANVKKLWNGVVGRYYKHPIVRKFGYLDEEVELLRSDIQEFAYKFMSILERNFEYYNTLLNEYTTASTHLMDTIKATNKNKVAFNDTPQNDNSTGEYEGDNFITTFTKTLGETESELNPKIMRLKEIQDNYKRVLNDWVKEFERIFFEEIGE